MCMRVMCVYSIYHVFVCMCMCTVSQWLAGSYMNIYTLCVYSIYHVFVCMCISTVSQWSAGSHMNINTLWLAAFLHAYTHKFIRGVKMFSTKTSRDVGMVDSVSDAIISSMERPTSGKSPGTRCIQWQCNNPVNIRCLQDTLWIHFHHPYIWQHFDAALLSWPQHLLNYIPSLHRQHYHAVWYVGHHICITIVICPLTHARKIVLNSIWPVAKHLYLGWYHVR